MLHPNAQHPLRTETYLGSDEELRLPSRISVPEIFRRHRDHHGVIDPEQIDLTIDKANWNRLSLDPFQATKRQELFIHVLSRFAYAATIIAGQLPSFYKAVPDKGENDIHRAITVDSRKVAQLCFHYLDSVANVTKIPEEALTKNYRILFDTVIKPHLLEFSETHLALKKTNPREVLKLEVRARTDYHLIAEGLGAVSGIKGLRVALDHLNSEMGNGEQVLPGLKETINAISMIERRNVAYGLFCLDRLANKNYFGTLKTLIGEFRSARPVLEEMRKETFARWEPFPFAIDREKLQLATTRHVKQWIRRLCRIGHRYNRLDSLDGII